MSKHTQGPWQVLGKTLCDKEGESIAEFLSVYTVDAKLMAAAPDMLEALKALVEACNKNLTGGHQLLIENAEDAISKAEGK